MVNNVRNDVAFKRIVLHLDHCLAKGKLPDYVRRTVDLHEETLIKIRNTCKELAKKEAKAQFDILQRYKRQSKRKKMDEDAEYQRRRSHFQHKTTRPSYQHWANPQEANA